MARVRKTKKGLALKRWFKEDWRTPRGKKDYSGGESTFRPTKRITKDTPVTWSELTPAEKARAAKEKREKGRVSRYKKKKAENGGVIDKIPSYFFVQNPYPKLEEMFKEIKRKRTYTKEELPKGGKKQDYNVNIKDILKGAPKRKK